MLFVLDGYTGYLLTLRGCFCYQVLEKRAVSQDLELWISREGVADGFNLVARAERTVQELHVTTQLSAQEMKRVVQAVLQQLL